MSSSSSSSTPTPCEMEKLHFILIPLMSQSHLIPFSNLAHLIAARGPIVTIITAPLSATSFRLPSDNPKVNILRLPFPPEAQQQPARHHSRDKFDSVPVFDRLIATTRHLRSPLLALLKDINPKPTCLVSDVIFTWTSDVARELRIPRLVFHVTSCFTLLCSRNLGGAIHAAEADSDPIRVPGIPERIEFMKSELPSMLLRGKYSTTDKFLEDWNEAEVTADGVLVNSCHELEPSFALGYGSLVRKLWCVGPVSVSLPTTAVKKSDDSSGCSKWLDQREPGSVIYVCFGTQSSISAAQLIEIGSGLADSGRPFVWIVRKANPDSLSKLEEWMETERYEERIKGRGMIIKGWAPQVPILSHVAVGGFVSHCGWNSTLESVSCGVPMVTWPLGAEQFFNEKLVVQVLEIGVRVGVKKMCTKEEEDVVCLVRRDEVKRAVEEMMGDGEESSRRRERARELGRVARRSVEDGGSSYVNLSMAIQGVIDKCTV